MACLVSGCLVLFPSLTENRQKYNCGPVLDVHQSCSDTVEKQAGCKYEYGYPLWIDRFSKASYRRVAAIGCG